MKKILILTAILFVVVYGASAQYYNNAPVPKIGLMLSSGAAVGPASGAYPDAGGIGVRLEMPINHSPVSFLFLTGYTFYVSQGSYYSDYYGYGYGYDYSNYNNSVASFIPVEAGIKIYVTHKFFIEGDAGVSFNINTYPSDYTGQATSFIYSPGAGYSFPLDYNGKSKIDVSLVYEDRQEPGGGYNQVAIRAVWNFDL